MNNIAIRVIRNRIYFRNVAGNDARFYIISKNVYKNYSWKGGGVKKFGVLLLGIAMVVGFIGCGSVGESPGGESPDTTPPVITLLGSPEITIGLGEVYVDPGAKAWDDRDGDLTDKIEVDNPVDTSKIGSYIVTYTVADSANNVATATRTVHVVVKNAVVIAADGSGDYACDGVEDHLVINQALEEVANDDALTTVYLKGPMTCVIEEPIVIFSSTKLLGERDVKVRLKDNVDWPENKPLIRQDSPPHWEGDLSEAIYGTEDDKIAHVEIGGFELTAGEQNASTGGYYYILMAFYTAEDLSVHDMYLHGSYGDIIRVMTLTENRQLSFYNNVIEDSGHEGLYLSTVSELQIYNNEIYDTRTNCGIRVTHSNHIEIHDNVIGNSLTSVPSGYAGIYVENRYSDHPLIAAEIYNNYIYGKAGGIVLRAKKTSDMSVSRGAHVHHNRIYRAFDNTAGGADYLNGGIHLYAVDGAVIENNTIDSSSKDGIVFEMGESTSSGYTTIVRNNIISNSAGVGINNLAGEDNHTFVSEYNTLYNNAGGNYYQADSDTDIYADPLFAYAEGTDPDLIDFHLQSRQGRWDGADWAFDDRTSPSIDSGDPDSPWDNEPSPNGGRVNAGAYGNTTEASRSDRVD